MEKTAIFKRTPYIDKKKIFTFCLVIVLGILFWGGIIWLVF